MENLKFVLARNLTAYRKANNLTQVELAEKLNYSDKAVSKWERAESVPDLVVLKNIADLYGITIDDLLKDKDITKIKVKSIAKNRKLSHLMIMFLSIALVWLIAVCAFVFLNFFSITVPGVTLFQSWHCFIIAIPLSCLLGVIFCYIWFAWYFKFVSISLLVWSLAMCADVMLLSLSIQNSYLFYLICVPIQMIIIFWFILIYNRKRKEKKKNVRKTKANLDESKAITEVKDEK